MNKAETVSMRKEIPHRVKNLYLITNFKKEKGRQICHVFISECHLRISGVIPNFYLLSAEFLTGPYSNHVFLRYHVIYQFALHNKF